MDSLLYYYNHEAAIDRKPKVGEIWMLALENGDEQCYMGTPVTIKSLWWDGGRIRGIEVYDREDHISEAGWVCSTDLISPIAWATVV